MNKRTISLIVFTLMIALGAAAMLPAGPSALAATPDPLSDFQEAAKLLLASLIGIPALVAAVLGLLEYLHYLTPTASDKVQLYLNTVLYLTCFIAVLMGKTDIVILIDRYAAGIAPILVALLALLSGAAYSVIATAGHLAKIRRIAPVREALIRISGLIAGNAL
jgi:hypothetical protein